MMTHLACIMDGNRRWAQKQGLRAWLGHRQGIKAVETIVNFCMEKGIPYLSLYTFSLENFKRSEDEKQFLWRLMVDQADRLIELCTKHNVQARFLGDHALFPADVKQTCDHIEQATAKGTKLTVNFLLGYGGQQEIVDGVKKIIARIKDGSLKEEEVSSELFRECLWTQGVPDPDLIIRTGGMRRLSNFLLYQAAYAEFYVLDCLWPELTKGDLEHAVNEFMQCQKNVGA